MQRHWLIIIPLLFLSPALAQQVNQVDAQGRKQGLWTKSYASGVPRYKAHFRNDTLIGEYIRFFPTGQKKSEMHYNNQGTYASATFYDMEGRVVSKGFYRGKTKDSTWRFYNVHGRLILKQQLHNGRKHGKEQFYYRNGELAEEKHYHLGTPKGVWRKYYDNGKKLMETVYRHGKLNGLYFTYHPDGLTLETEGAYQDNLRTGPWITYNNQGQPLDTIHYVEGVPQNLDEVEQENTQQVNELENMRGKVPDPKEQFYQNPRFRGY